MAAADPANPERHIEAARLMNSLPKHVVSTTLRSVSWSNSQIINGHVEGTLTRLKQESKKDLALFAGATMAMTAIRLGLIDEFRLIVEPALLGGGKRLFDGSHDRIDLKLRQARPFKSGAVALCYDASPRP